MSDPFSSPKIKQGGQRQDIEGSRGHAEKKGSLRGRGKREGEIAREWVCKKEYVG